MGRILRGIWSQCVVPRSAVQCAFFCAPHKCKYAVVCVEHEHIIILLNAIFILSQQATQIFCTLYVAIPQFSLCSEVPNLVVLVAEECLELVLTVCLVLFVYTITHCSL
jgi:hypothetical protein